MKKVELVSSGVRGIKNPCLGCVFYEKNYTCNHKEKKKHISYAGDCDTVKHSWGEHYEFIKENL